MACLRRVAFLSAICFALAATAGEARSLVGHDPVSTFRANRGNCPACFRDDFDDMLQSSDPAGPRATPDGGNFTTARRPPRSSAGLASP